MHDLRHKTRELAMKADRVILHAEEADHVRMDLAAHEKVHLKDLIKKQNLFGRPKNEPFFIFSFSALFIFSILFSATNFQAYSKILSANFFKQPTELVIEEEAPKVETLEEAEAITASNDGLIPIDIAVAPYENRIEIPKINVNAPIITPEKGVEALVANDWSVLEDAISESLLRGVVHYPGTAEPGDKGNAFFTGHSSNVFWDLSKYNTVFALLPKLEVGDDVYVYFEQTRYHYRIISKKEVSPKDVSILEQGNEKHLTLMTCTPVGTNLKRMVLTAELID